ncbi:methyltransferase [Roseibium aquae]|uniref:Methyltransferase n=1 Tax=Roseibium aquae TaxID=1323746 RepID=A0A916X1L1_9HYPH|nr:rRNA adenine N-6-methyltransferase family protein [Roseibium aquae]GGB48110.1 methyltransferase [Roseibium aquae]
MDNLKRAGAAAVKRTLRRLKPARLHGTDELAFLKNWVDSPLKTGAIAPSGSELATAMAAVIDPSPHAQVLELGPGTGSVTRAILERGVSPSNLTVLEYSSEFCRLLALRHPAINVIQGDAYTLSKTLAAAAGGAECRYSAIVSSLPLLTRPEEVREILIRQALGLMPRGAPFIQFSYGLRPPVPAKRGAYTVASSKWIWKNLPPARVWTYRSED